MTIARVYTYTLRLIIKCEYVHNFDYVVGTAVIMSSEHRGPQMLHSFVLHDPTSEMILILSYITVILT